MIIPALAAIYYFSANADFGNCHGLRRGQPCCSPLGGPMQYLIVRAFPGRRNSGRSRHPDSLQFIKRPGRVAGRPLHPCPLRADLAGAAGHTLCRNRRLHYFSGFTGAGRAPL